MEEKEGNIVQDRDQDPAQDPDLLHQAHHGRKGEDSTDYREILADCNVIL